jgi:hypothetical protein
MTGHRRKLFFIDFEACSLGVNSWPIEIAWVDENGQGESYLIKPSKEWDVDEWSYNSQNVHGISLETLEREGTPAEIVAKRAAAILGKPGAIALADQPAFDGYWLDCLLEAADLPAIYVHNVVTAYELQCQQLMELAGATDDDGSEREYLKTKFARLVGVDIVETTATEIVREARAAEGVRPRVRHRALEDATSLWRIWRDVGDRVQAALAAHRGT